MMGHTEGGVAIRWTHGVLSAVIDQDTTQLFRISQQVCTRHRRNEDGSYEAAYLEFVYFSDLKTGEVMETWNNPYTDRTVTVPAQILGPAKVKDSHRPQSRQRTFSNGGSGQHALDGAAADFRR